MPTYPRAKNHSLGRLFIKGLTTLAFLTTLASMSSTVSTGGDTEPKPTITILIQNHMRVPHTVLAKAERTVDNIFDRGGVKMVWVECPAEPSAVISQEECQKPLDHSCIRLDLISARIKGDSRDCVWGSTSHPNIARVYYEHVTHFAVEYELESGMASILGCVIAHEIGHLLLGPKSHYGIGIMQPRWSLPQVRQGLMGVLRFTPEQSERIRAEATRRAGSYK